MNKPGKIDLTQIPYISARQMLEVDRLMIEEFGIQLIQMMENAGRHLAALARTRFLDGDPAGKRVIFLAGSGGNGGGALVSARNLVNWGADVHVYLSKPVDHLSGTILKQAKILQSLNLKLLSISDLGSTDAPDLIVDGIIGYSLQGSPRGTAAAMINWANQQEKPILALDVPSGLDATTGEVKNPVIKASATMTLALPKTGLKIASREVVGELYLADIGIPPLLYSYPSLGFNIGPIFKYEQIIQLM